MLCNAPFVYYKTKGAGYVPEGKYPGDPTPLLFATNLAMREAKMGGFDSSGFRPDFGEEVYNPVIWNESIRRDLVGRLRANPPAVFAASGTSPAWPFLRQIIQEVRGNTDALTIVGGPHMDEMWQTGGKLHPAHPLFVSQELFEIAVSGDGQYPFLLLLQAAAESLAQTGGRLDKAAVKQLLLDKAGEIGRLPGKSLIAFRTGDGSGKLAALKTSGRRLSLSDYGSPYEHFAPQARFPIFRSGLADERHRTAHLMSTFGCAFNCAFCSERGNLLFSRSEIANCVLGLITVAELKGVRNFFFDDSVLMAGAWDCIEWFSDCLLEQGRHYLEWGGQLTVDNLTPRGSFALADAGSFTEGQITRTLRKMRNSGFSYLYIGLESGSEAVMSHIDKAKRLNGLWRRQVEAAMRRVKNAGIRVGTSIMFGNLGETRETVDKTIDFVAHLIDQKLLDYVSINLATYHPDTPLSRIDGVAEALRYDAVPAHPGVLYELFEEADPGRVSKRMTEELMRHILGRVAAEWGEALTSVERIREIISYGYPSLNFCEVGPAEEAVCG